MTPLDVDGNIIDWILTTNENTLGTWGTTQSGVILPLLWLLVVNKVFISLTTSGIKVIAYADNLIILSTGKFIDTAARQISMLQIYQCDMSFFIDSQLLSSH